mgnify:CR=1 FL=1
MQPAVMIKPTVVGRGRFDTLSHLRSGCVGSHSRAARAWIALCTPTACPARPAPPKPSPAHTPSPACSVFEPARPPPDQGHGERASGEGFGQKGGGLHEGLTKRGAAPAASTGQAAACRYARCLRDAGSSHQSLTARPPSHPAAQPPSRPGRSPIPPVNHNITPTLHTQPTGSCLQPRLPGAAQRAALWRAGVRPPPDRPRRPHLGALRFGQWWPAGSVSRMWCMGTVVRIPTVASPQQAEIRCCLHSPWSLAERRPSHLHSLFASARPTTGHFG